MTQRRPAGGKGGMRTRNTASPTRQGVAAKELQAARRKKRQKEVMRNRIIFGVICVGLLALLVTLVVKLGGAFLSSGGAADTSTITFQRMDRLLSRKLQTLIPRLTPRQNLRNIHVT